MGYITSRKNPLVVHLKKLASDRDYRRECGEYLCQGTKLFSEALLSGADTVSIINIVFSGQIPENITDTEVSIDEVPSGILEYISPMKSAPELIFSCKIQAKQNTGLSPGRHMLLEGIQDPGNIGTIIRSANALSFDSVILLDGCADVYNPKSVRAAMGALFRQQILEYKSDDLYDCLEGCDMPLYAMVSSDGTDIRKVDFPESFIAAVGNEGQGLSVRLIERSSQRIKIPMSINSESLNVAIASSIFMWEIQRRIR